MLFDSLIHDVMSYDCVCFMEHFSFTLQTLKGSYSYWYLQGTALLIDGMSWDGFFYVDVPCQLPTQPGKGMWRWVAFVGMTCEIL